MPRFSVAATLLVVLSFASSSFAHFPWVQIDKQNGESGAVLVHFEEGPRAGDGKYLGPFVERGKLWFRTPNQKATLLTAKEVKNDSKRWLQADLPEKTPRSADFYVKWGVYRYGKTDVLLHYYARSIDAYTVNDLKQLSVADHLDLHMQPSWEGGKLSIRLTWRGEPVPDRLIIVRGMKPQRTDADGKATFAIERSGMYHLRTHIEEETPGEFDGKTFQKIHRHTTLSLRLPPK